jgi:hypothetical protein
MVQENVGSSCVELKDLYRTRIPARSYPVSLRERELGELRELEELGGMRPRGCKL